MHAEKDVLLAVQAVEGSGALRATWPLCKTADTATPAVSASPRGSPSGSKPITTKKRNSAEVPVSKTGPTTGVIGAEGSLAGFRGARAGNASESGEQVGACPCAIVGH